MDATATRTRSLLVRPVRPSLWWALAVFALSAALTAMGWLSARSEAASEAAARFRAESERISTHIAGRLLAYEQVLRGGVSVFDTWGMVTRDQWRSYVEGLRIADDYPGIQGIGFAQIDADAVPGAYVMLAVTDTGTGMAADVIERAFEPFFTTKEVGKGSGLGLSMVYGFARQSGGHAKIYSEVCHGTTVRLYLPRHVAAGSLAAAPANGTADHPSGGETIVVVEDDPLVRRLAVMQLQELGYRVLEAANGPEAQRILQGEEHIDLLFTDVVMPGGMTGRQLSDAAKARRPHLKTLFTSGYTQDSIIHQGKLDPGVHFLAKPYKKRDLALKVRAVLDASA